MFKKTITYTDYNGISRTEDFYFNLSKAELMEMEFGTEGGFNEQMQRIISAKESTTIFKAFKDIVLRAYGIKSPDGKRFIKSKEIQDEFTQTEAYSALFMELASDADVAAEFIKGIIPADLAKEIDNVDLDTMNVAI